MTPNETTSVANHSKPKRVPSWLWAGLVALALGLAAVVFIAGHDLLELISVKTLGLNYDTLKHHVADHPGLAVLAYFAAYALLGVLLLL